MRLRQFGVIELNLHIDDVRDPLTRHRLHILRGPYPAAHRDLLRQPRNIHPAPVTLSPSIADAPRAPLILRQLRVPRLSRPHPDRNPLISTRPPHSTEPPSGKISSGERLPKSTH